MNFGKGIKKLRHAHNMTQKQLAKCMGMSINAISCLEIGRTNPPMGTVKKLCKVFGIPMSYFCILSIEECDFPENKRLLYRALLVPLLSELLRDSEKRL